MAADCRSRPRSPPADDAASDVSRTACVRAVVGLSGTGDDNAGWGCRRGDGAKVTVGRGVAAEEPCGMVDEGGWGSSCGAGLDIWLVLPRSSAVLALLSVRAEKRSKPVLAAPGLRSDANGELSAIARVDIASVSLKTWSICACTMDWCKLCCAERTRTSPARRRRSAQNWSVKFCSVDDICMRPVMALTGDVGSEEAITASSGGVGLGVLLRRREVRRSTADLTDRGDGWLLDSVAAVRCVFAPFRDLLSGISYCKWMPLEESESESESDIANERSSLAWRPSSDCMAMSAWSRASFKY